MNIVIAIIIAIIGIAICYGVMAVVRGIYVLDARAERESRARGYRVYNAAPGALVPEWKRVDE